MRLGLEDIDGMLDVSEAAEKLGVSEDTIYRMVGRRDIDCVRVGSGRGRIKIPTSALVDYLNRHLTTSVANAPKRKRTAS